MAELCSIMHIFQPSVNIFYFRHLICVYVTLMRSVKILIKILRICIFNMAAKMAELCTKKHIFLSAVHNFYCNSLIFSYVSLLTIPWNILKFDSFAYSIWPPKWPNYVQKSIFSCLQSTVFIVWVSNFHIYLCLRSHRKSLTFGAFAYSIWPPKWPNILQQCWLQAEKCAFST